MFRHLFLGSFCLALSVLLTTTVHAQRPAPPGIGCIDRAIRGRADEIKQHYTAQGFEVMRDAMLSMSSTTPFPVMVELQRGQLYQIIYVAHPSATRISLETYDSEQQRIDRKQQTVGRGQPTYMTFAFIPERTDLYLFMPAQKWKDNEMCGAFTILKPKADAKGVSIIPYTEGGQP